MGQKKFAYRSLAVATLLALSTGGAHASGFSVPEISIAGTAMSNALVANHELLGAIPYNPSLAAFHSGLTVAGGINVVHAESEATPAGGTTVNFQGMDNVFIPTLQATYELRDGVVLGFGTSVPFGLSTDYPTSAFAGTLGPNAPTRSKVEVIDIKPTVAFKLNPNTAVAVGVDYYWVREVVFDTAAVKNEGDGGDWGWNASLSHVQGPFSIGASFHSRSEVDISGSTIIPGVSTGTASTSLVVPWRAQIGARYEFSDALAMEFDISRIGWNSFDVLSISHTNPLVPVNPITSTNNWKDANAYRLGGSYQVDESLQLRFGYTYDETGQPMSLFSPRTADADRHLFSIGLEKSLGDGLALEASYMLVKFDDTTLASTAPTIPGEPNGSPAYNGTYETTVHLLGVGLSKRFDL